MAIIFERSQDTNAVIEVLRGVNDQITYRELANRSGLALRRSKEVLTSARRSLMRESILFGVIRGEGLVRLSEAQKLDAVDGDIEKSARCSRRGLKKSSTIELGKLDKAFQHRHTTQRTIMSVIIGQAKSRVKEEKTQTSSAPLPNVQSIVDLRKKA